MRRQFQSDIQGSEDDECWRGDTLANCLLSFMCGYLADANNSTTRFSEGMRNRVEESRTQLSRRAPLLIIARINSDSPRSIYIDYM